MSTIVAPKEQLAQEGGRKAVEQFVGQSQPKLGVEEFMSLAERFGFSSSAQARIRAAISDDDLGPGPNLARYATAYPAKTKGEAFEQLARKLFGTEYALSVSSGTAALHCAFVAAGVGPGSEVIVPAIGFYATAAAVVQSKGVPVFCDVNESLAIAPTHVMGSVCDMDPILEIAHKHDLSVIEDCAQSPGAKYRGRYVGTFGNLGCFSISAYKIIGGGEGGLLLTHEQRLWERANQFAEAGGLWRPDRFAPPRYEGELFNGTNYRMSELEAAVDVVQLGKLNAVVERFHNVKMQILQQLKSYREIKPQLLNDPNGEIGYLLRFFPQTLDLSQKIVAALQAEGIPCSTRGSEPRPDWHLYSDMFPITLKSGTTSTDRPFDQAVYRERGGHVEYQRGDCPVADDLFNRGVIIYLNQWFAPEDCNNIARGINKVLSAYCTEDSMAISWL
ncbi:DegT/DnrJ/EryC1/StrS family aminotransferase [Chloroflexi bacterium TSY]|nr:DegT/DnrJ/EryC1/StrS family aminotransferase [Chloroflexi bacterium TSY]